MRVRVQQLVATFVVFVALMAVAVVSTSARQVAGQAPAAAPAAPPPPPEPQAGHPSGKLVIWGDLADMSRPGTPLRCFNTNRFRRGQRAGFRMTAVDGGTGQVENTAELVVHLNYGGRVIDIPMRWRGVGNFNASEYSRRPSEMWTAVWEVPADASVGSFTYTVTAKDRFGRTATFEPFPNNLTQFTVIE
ncbi:MAG: hypothetical protein HOP16_15840 [Acidobacteria bacterium]|nr:hypothetical protein [Acidobacteriota bacterium]